MAVEPGTIVLLNGTASSGKTSIARALQELMPDVWLNAGVDRFLAMLPARYLEWPLWSDVMGRFDRPGAVGSVLIPLDVVVRRELERGNRDVGEAELQHPLVHRHGIYDFEVDTSVLTAPQAAAAIRDRIAAGPAPSAFRQLAAA